MAESTQIRPRPPADGHAPAGPGVAPVGPPLPHPNLPLPRGDAPGSAPGPRHGPTGPSPIEPPNEADADAGSDAARRHFRRRPAGPARGAVAANDDVPSIGGLIFALHQKPSRRPFTVATGLTVAWLVVGALIAYVTLAADWQQSATLGEFATRPGPLSILATIVIPIALFWFLALLMWRAHELRLMSSAMTEVAVRLAEPDRLAEQSIASLGQSVRRQVAYMNDAIGRALGRAGELEALVHNEVAALERSYSENEFRIRRLIDEIASERAALANNSDRVTETLQGLGSRVSQEVIAASRQATEQLTEATRNIAHLIESRTGAIASAADSAGSVIDQKLSERGNSLLSSLSVMTQRIGSEVPVIIERMSQEQVRLTKIIEQSTGNLQALESALGGRTQQLDKVLKGTTQALDQSLAGHSRHMAELLDQRARGIEASIGRGVGMVDAAIARGAEVVERSVSQRTVALASAMEEHARALGESLSRKSADLDETLLRGVEAVRRSSENITKQSVKTIEGLASQASLLKDVSENLLAQINTLTQRFENQGKSILKAAHALETSNLKVDTVLQQRHTELSELLERMSDRARTFDSAVKDYSRTLDSSLTEAERRALDTAQGLARATETRSREAVEHFERLRSTAEAEAERTLANLRERLASVSSEMSSELSSVSSRVTATTDEVRERALKAAGELEALHLQLRDQIHALPEASRANAEHVRRALQDQLKALEQLSAFANRQAQRSGDVVAPDRTSLGTLTQAYASRVRPEERGRPVDPNLAADIARELAGSGAPPRQPGVPQLPPPANAQGGPRDRAGWSLGDLLDRASRDEKGEAPRTAAAPGGTPMPLPPAGTAPGPRGPTPEGAQHRQSAINIGNMAQALDPVMAADLWTRVRAGQRGILSRGIYTPNGQSTFDEIAQRYRLDPAFQASVNRYLGDFERLLRDAETREPGGRIAENYLISETGRVYLLLAHASGRLV